MSSVIAFLLRLGFGGIVDKGIAVLERRAELENDSERLRTQATVELAKHVVEEARIAAEVNRAKLSLPWFGALVWAIAMPMIVWLWAVVIDCIPVLRDLWGDEQVFDLPTAALQDTFSMMIQFAFGAGVVTGGVGALAKIFKK